MARELTILGVDPGFALTGLGVIKAKGQQIEMVEYGCVTTYAGENFSSRLKQINEQMAALIKKHKPDVVAVEELFFAKNTKTAMKVGHARGVVLLTAIQAGVSLLEFTPLQVKQAITGYGRADKQQMQQMVKLLLKLQEVPKPDDAADALAVAICAASSHKLIALYDEK